MKILNAIAAIAVILFVADHFAHDIMAGYAIKKAQQELKSQEFRDTLQGLGLLDPDATAP